MADRYSLPEEPEVEMTDSNLKLQEVLKHFNRRVENAPCTYLLCSGSDFVEDYTLALDLDKNVHGKKFYRGPRGLAVDLKIDYEKAFKEAFFESFPSRATFGLRSPRFLQDALAVYDLTARLSTKLEGDRELIQYDIVGDRVQDVAFGDLLDLDKIPKKYLGLMNNIQKGEDARKAVDLAFDLWEWDNDM